MKKKAKKSTKKLGSGKPAKPGKLWSGRFTEATDPRAEALNASIDFDKRLLRHDIRGSVAHARTLKRARVITAKECARIVGGLGTVEREIKAGRVELTAASEDIHMAVEKRLTEKLGPLGGKLHTARSRNDQVALDTRLYIKEEIKGILGLLLTLRRALLTVAKRNVETVMPGYTHLQRAQPVTLAHHMLAYEGMLGRDCERLSSCHDRADVMPLGSGALAGSPYNLDRSYTAKLLGFSRVSENSMDAVSSRDYIIEFLSAGAILMMHLSRLSEELVLWSSTEFGFIEFSDAYSTGSSIMPQKKNPDLAELARGKTGRVYGNLFTLLTVMKALPLAYNKDMQEDKEPLFDTVDTIRACLEVYSPMLKSMNVKKKRLREAAEGVHGGDAFITATDAADYLACKGVPFRRAHEAVGAAVLYCVEHEKSLASLTLPEWRRFSKYFGDDIVRAVTIEGSINKRKLKGGTAPSEIKKSIMRVERELKRA